MQLVLKPMLWHTHFQSRQVYLSCDFDGQMNSAEHEGLIGVKFNLLVPSVSRGFDFQQGYSVHAPQNVQSRHRALRVVSCCLSL